MYKILEVIIWKSNNKISEIVIKFIKNKNKEIRINNGVIDMIKICQCMWY